ncbi:MAG TPA: hypothetical protein VN700_12465 [Vicinamibacterales bacterium]|nr:hypothetical protein [Vicinamibacterales bacterium]
MHVSLSLRVAAAIFALHSLATPAIAQDPPLNRTPVELAVGEQVRVATRDGKVRNGRLSRVTAAEVVVLGGRRLHEIPWTDVKQIDRLASAVSVRRSTLIGLGIGLGVGAVSVATGGCEEDAGTFAVQCVGFVAGVGAGAGALTGVIRNAFRPSRVVYRGDRQRGFLLAPVVYKHRAGVVGTIRW